jgi:hypothetical protein
MHYATQDFYNYNPEQRENIFPYGINGLMSLMESILCALRQEMDFSMQFTHNSRNEGLIVTHFVWWFKK